MIEYEESVARSLVKHGREVWYESTVWTEGCGLVGVTIVLDRNVSELAYGSEFRFRLAFDEELDAQTVLAVKDKVTAEVARVLPEIVMKALDMLARTTTEGTES